MNALRNVVVGLDLTAASRGALGQASRIAARNDAMLYAMHAIEPSVVDEVLAFVGLGRDPPWDAIRSRVLELAQRAADGLDGGPRGEGAGARLAIDTRVDVEVGAPVEVLSRAVRAYAAGLLVLGLRRPARVGHGPGPVARACLRHAPTTVLLAREDHAGPYASIVACTDFADTSFRAVELAVRLARLDRATLRIVHIAMPPGPDMDYTGDPLGLWPRRPIELKEVWAAYRASLEPRLARFVEPLAAEMAEITFTLDITEHGHYGRGIVAYAKTHHADLLVLGNQRRANLRDARLGSTTERVLAELACSALVVKPAEVPHSPARARVEAGVAEHSAGGW